MNWNKDWLLYLKLDDQMYMMLISEQELGNTMMMAILIGRQPVTLRFQPILLEGF